MKKKRDTSNPPHPMQPVLLVGDVVRFKENAIIRYLVEGYPGRLNALGIVGGGSRWSTEDWEQLWQLIGYSVSGYGDISGVRRASVRRADRRAADLLRRLKKKKKR